MKRENETPWVTFETQQIRITKVRRTYRVATTTFDATTNAAKIDG